MKVNHIVLKLVCCGCLLWGCEETIHPTLQYADPVLVVDAWINDKPEAQNIRITQTQPYFENELPHGVMGAIISMNDGMGHTFVFNEVAGEDGNYRWTPGPGDNLFPGTEYTLSVHVGTEQFVAACKMRRTTPVDSITFKKEDNINFYPEGSFTGQFWATDPIGTGDTYWIRTYKNGMLLSKPSEINIAYDAGFSAGGNFDGVTFIPPKRQAINPMDVDANNKLLAPYELGDSVYVEIHSISHEAFNFLNEVIVQTSRPGGFAELFATPLANVSTNIVNVNPQGLPVVGFFNVAAVQGKGRKF